MKGKLNMALLLFFLLAGVITGALLASLAFGIPFLSWLAYGKNFGLSVQEPLIVDFSVIRLALGFEISINIAQIITITLSMLLYRLVGKKI